MARNRKNILRSIPAWIVAAIIMLATDGCTQNNGDIGPWFGAWTLRTIEVDGVADYGYPAGSQTWKFQASIIDVVQLLETNTVSDNYGSWRQLSGTQLELNFGHSDNNTPAGTGLYAPPRYTHLPAGIAVLEINLLTDSNLILTYRDDDGIAYTYHLTK